MATPWDSSDDKDKEKLLLSPLLPSSELEFVDEDDDNDDEEAAPGLRCLKRPSPRFYFLRQQLFRGRNKVWGVE